MPDTLTTEDPTPTDRAQGAPLDAAGPAGALTGDRLQVSPALVMDSAPDAPRSHPGLSGDVGSR